MRAKLCRLAGVALQAVLNSSAALHVGDALEGLVQLQLLAHQPGALLLGQVRVRFLAGEQLVQLLVAVDAFSNGAEVREHSAQPALVDVRHAAAGGLFHHRVLRLPLRADEEQVLARRREVGDEFRGFLELLERLLQVDDVDPIALAEDELLHLRVPALGLVTEVDASLEQFLHRNRCQMTPPFLVDS